MKTNAEKCAGFIQLTFCDRQNNGFVTLGGIGLLTNDEVQQYWDDIPTFQGVSDFIADRLDASRSITADKPISAEMCERYLGKPIAELIEEGRAKTCFTIGDLKKKHPELADDYPALFAAS